MPTLPKEPQIIGLITPEVFDGKTFSFRDEIELCDALEIRYDLFDDPMEWKNIAPIVREAFIDKEILGTIRLESDGGAFSDSLVEKRNILLYELMMLGKWDWVDLEYEQILFLPELLKGARESNTQVITSHHNFNKAYSLDQYISMGIGMTLAGSDALKFSVMANSEDDIDELYRFVEENSQKAIPLPIMSAFSMGEVGQQTRSKTPTIGAPYAYGFFGEIPPVSGQLSVKKLHQILKLR